MKRLYKTESPSFFFFLVCSLFAKAAVLIFISVLFFMLNSAEHENCSANKYQITDNCKFSFAKHS